MNARALTGQALAAALRKAVDPAVSQALQRNAERLRQALEGTNAEGTEPSPLPEGEVGPQGRVRVYGLSGEVPKPSPAALRASTSPSGRGDESTPSLGNVSHSSHSRDLTLSGENLFAREFGALGAAADPVIAPAIQRLRRTSR
ncbi:hypothetical protein OSH10_13680 [Kaistia defluvii]|uniref:hypothetical protein n=1 Tax=Kaistia defluvii TaxID=410841 RepID=UPI0022594322|nr:hypothetical protein [Kaistia defluvii]MCX5519487.1 hypothetical protein [Kaistia defluvii]